MSDREQSVFVLGYGNPGRQDDGLGPKAADLITSLGLPFITVDAAFQLNIEDAEAISGYDTVVFVDASVSAPEPFSFDSLSPADDITFTSHSVSPGSIMRLCADHFGPAPRGWVMAIRGYSFEFEEGLTGQAQRNLESALAFLSDFLIKQSQKSPPEKPASGPVQMSMK
ncbi:MAG: hydrogenase maturation protease [Deltaproteobacteria bacterium]|nr:hydrogenase maturation protease [Candidatus Zymogenaceae bacterium]